MLFVFSNVFSQDPISPFTNSDKVVMNHNYEIKGHEYLYEPWNRGLLVMNDTLFFMQNYLRYDAYNDRVLVKKHNNDSNVFEINDIDLTGFSITDASNINKHNYVKLQPSNFLDGKSSGFFEVVMNIYRTNYFLMKTTKIIYDPNKSKGTQAQNNLQSEFREKKYYFVKNEAGLYVKVRLKKKDIMALLTNHSSQVNAYIYSRKVNFNRPKQVAQLVNYYYTL
jgi:hypothetical protein